MRIKTPLKLFKEQPRSKAQYFYSTLKINLISFSFITQINPANHETFLSKKFQKQD